MTEPLTVLYNADCPICAREIAAYRARAARTGAPVAFEALGAADLASWGLGADSAARRLHVRQGGQVTAGLGAFRMLWAALPGLGWLARATGLPVLGWLARVAYDHAAAPLLYAMHRRRVARACAAACQPPRGA